MLAYDRAAGVLVMSDMTMWELPMGLAIPADLGAGDRVILSFESEGEDGMGMITALDRVAIALPEGTDGGV